MTQHPETLRLLHERLQCLAPQSLGVIDESHLHAGHAGNGGGAHFNLSIVSKYFDGLNTPQRHRLIFQALGDLMQGPIHALSIQAKTPDSVSNASF